MSAKSATNDAIAIHSTIYDATITRRDRPRQ
jgi:hypothetical protein